MNDRAPAAFFVSLTLHAAVVAVFFLLSYVAHEQAKPVTEAFILVAGEGDNFAATEAPALGVPGGIKLNLPPTPAPKKPVESPRVEPEPAKPEVAPVAPTPAATKAPPVTEKPPPDPSAKNAAPTKTKTLTEELRWQQIRAESKAKQKAQREREAEQKRLAAERAEQAKRDKLVAASGAKAPRVDVDGIAKGVLGGSTANKTGGAGGTALTRNEGPVLDAYFEVLRERLLKALDKPAGLSDTLVAEVEFRLNADGSLTGVKIIGPSGSAEFDRAVLDAYARVRLPERPDKKSSVHQLRFRTKDLDGI